MKMSVLYFSKTGNTKKMAERIAEGMRSAPGVEAKAFSIEAVDEAFIKESMSSIPVSAGRSCHAASIPFFAPERNAP